MAQQLAKFFDLGVENVETSRNPNNFSTDLRLVFKDGSSILHNLTDVEQHLLARDGMTLGIRDKILNHNARHDGMDHMAIIPQLWHEKQARMEARSAKLHDSMYGKLVGKYCGIDVTAEEYATIRLENRAKVLRDTAASLEINKGKYYGFDVLGAKPGDIIETKKRPMPETKSFNKHHKKKYDRGKKKEYAKNKKRNPVGIAIWFLLSSLAGGFLFKYCHEYIIELVTKGLDL